MKKNTSFHSCIRALSEFKADHFILVIFGGAGDLSQKKLMPTLYSLYKNNFIQNFKIVGIGSSKIERKEYLNKIKKWLKTFYKNSFDLKIFEKFKKSIIYESIDLRKEESYDILCTSLKKLSKTIKTKNIIYYLAVPPKIVPITVKMLEKKHLCREKKDAKIVIEKPFGKNKKTSHELNKNLLKAFDEKQIYRIDHYLGKETVQNVFFLRFGNTIFEPLWNRNYIENVQITVFEEMGMEGRGVFYEQSGIIRDIVQNHVMQLIALTAMEPPSDFKAESLRDERVKILKSIKKVKKEDFIIGQYEKGVIDKKMVKGYLEEANISKNSKNPTYFAGKFFIDNWRWEGVPFYVRTGKRVKKRITEIAIHFKYPPLKLLGHVCGELEQNTLVFSIYPNQKISLLFNVKFPGMENAPYPVDMVFDYKKTFKVEPPLSYERLLIDLMKSDLTLFARQDGVETMWSVVDPIIESSKGKKLFKYKAGSLGPKNIFSLLQKGHVWRDV